MGRGFESLLFCHFGMNTEIKNKVKEILGEMYPNYCFVVLDEVGEVHCEYTSPAVARMLLNESQRNIGMDPLLDIDWDDDDDLEGIKL